MRKIVALGGGSIGYGSVKPEVLSISREIIRLSGKKNPYLTFLPTASSDDRAYVRTVENHFGRKLGCRVSALCLLSRKLTSSELRKALMGADIIYVGGGNTLMMMNRWKRLGVDLYLKKAHAKGTVLCGTSAGAICWFESGNSDSRKFKNPRAKLIRVGGLGLVKALFCPHYDIEKDRKPELKAMMKNIPGVALAATNCAALEIVGSRYRVLISKSGARVFKVYWTAGKFYEIKLPSGKEWKNLAQLTEK